jgi:hypothetical protein
MLGGRLPLQALPVALASADRRSEDVRVFAVIIAELKLGNIERHVFLADLVEAPDDPALEDRPPAATVKSRIIALIADAGAVCRLTEFAHSMPARA